jgi:hypothetical protein
VLSGVLFGVYSKEKSRCVEGWTRLGGGMGWAMLLAGILDGVDATYGVCGGVG